MKRLIVISLLILVSVAGCSDRDDNITAVNIRIRNTSTIAYDAVQVGSDENLYENVASGDFSDYLEYETAFRFAFIEIRSGEETFVLQPIDFVGETPLAIGFYTYELNISEDGEILLEFVTD